MPSKLAFSESDGKSVGEHHCPVNVSGKAHDLVLERFGERLVVRKLHGGTRTSLAHGADAGFVAEQLRKGNLRMNNLQVPA